MSGQMRLLLDKHALSIVEGNVVRRYFEGVSALARGLTLVEEEQLMRKWALEKSELQERLARMTEAMDDPFGRARLPDVLRPEEIT